MSVPEYLERMLRLAHQCDVREQLDWTLNLGGDEVIFVVECADLFLENEYETLPVTPADVDAFERALRDVGAVTDGDFTFGPPLYACRVRGRRPCNMGFPADPRVHALFNAAGPDRALAGDPSGRHAVVEAHTPGALTRSFMFPADRFVLTSPGRPHIPGAAPPPLPVAAFEVHSGDGLADTDLGKQQPTLSTVGTLTAGEGWPVLTIGERVEPPPHPCAPRGVGGPEHCDLCGRTFNDNEIERAALEATGQTTAKDS